MLDEYIVELKKTLNPKSKFYNSDLLSSIEAFKSKSKGEKIRILNNLKCLNSAKYEKLVDKEVSEMGRGGMFNLKNCIKEALN